MAGVSFTGDGAKDATGGNTNTVPSQPGGSKGPVDFAGNGQKDASKSFGTNVPSEKAKGAGIVSPVKNV